MRTFLQTLIFSGFLALGLTTTQASPLYTFMALPSTGTTPSAEGSKVGWGYTISNNSDNYLITTSLNADLFEHGVPFVLFDFPAIAPHTIVEAAYVPDVSGLYQLTWDENTPLGFLNAGFFTLNVEFFNGDPLNNGQFLSAPERAFSGYSAIFAESGFNPIPEPKTTMLFLTNILLLLRFTCSQREYIPSSASPKK